MAIAPRWTHFSDSVVEENQGTVLNTWVNVVHSSVLFFEIFVFVNQSYFNSHLFFCSTLKYPRQILPLMPSTNLIFICLTWARTTLREALSASTSMCQGKGHWAADFSHTVGSGAAGG